MKVNIYLCFWVVNMPIIEWYLILMGRPQYLTVEDGESYVLWERYNTIVPAIVNCIERDMLLLWLSPRINMGFAFEQRVNFWMFFRTSTKMSEIIQSDLVATSNDHSGARGITNHGDIVFPFAAMILPNVTNSPLSADTIWSTSFWLLSAKTLGVLRNVEMQDSSKLPVCGKAVSAVNNFKVQKRIHLQQFY